MTPSDRDVFSVISDPTRREILELLATMEMNVTGLGRHFDVSRPAISKHLRVLERAGLVRRTRDGRVSYCGLNAKPMRDAAEWVERYRKFWEGQLESLARYLEQDNHK